MERDFILWLVGYMEGLQAIECTKPYFDVIQSKVNSMFVVRETYEEMKLRDQWESLDGKNPN